MRVADLTWMQLEALVAREDRAVLPIGSTEQHAYLSLATDDILAERVATEAAEPLGVPVFPLLGYGVTPMFTGYPGTVTLSTDTFTRVVREILDGMHGSGFRRLLIVNGHGGNTALRGIAEAWTAAHDGAEARVHDWWNAPRTWAKAQAIDPVATHASWMENFPWTRIADVTPPRDAKPMVDRSRFTGDPAVAREALGDGNFGGLYQRDDRDVLALWAVAVEETRARLAEWSPRTGV
ncbi:MAG: creatininase family protein [Candidatus Eisenbacteria bacterium]|uniref:Creatininase family protein n=1 Tax=Eiseniibacteriota bacterium TaxID=2212470 RepID=A0A9D6L797_UNCEI|nr:creatininase family protein [Candidatus Eisenbacteria bacterium]MBI3539149.1 creatininase family protein [Candidatus Eisenbacteria bacterium]